MGKITKFGDMSQAATKLSIQDFSDLQWAHQHREHPSFAGRLEREYGSKTIRVEFERLTRKGKEAEKQFSPLEGW